MPGAWGGAWSWNKRVVPLLRGAGHDVYPVTLTGLGDRSHLATPDVNLDTHIQDVVNVLFYEDLNDVILVGHSYGGNVITGVADRVPERLQQLVYLDAATPSDGDSSASRWPGRAEDLREQARKDGDGWKIAPGTPPPDQPAETTDWARPRRASQPIQTMLQPLKLERGETTLPRTFVYCTLDKKSGSPQAERAARVRANPAWQFFELDTGHNLHYTAPEATVEILIKLARRSRSPGRNCATRSVRIASVAGRATIRATQSDILVCWPRVVRPDDVWPDRKVGKPAQVPLPAGWIGRGRVRRHGTFRSPLTIRLSRA